MNWKEIGVGESEMAFWEIVNNDEKETITLYYVPEENYGDKDVKIEIPYNQFEDLINFIKKIS